MIKQMLLNCPFFRVVIHEINQFVDNIEPITGNLVVSTFFKIVEMGKNSPQCSEIPIRYRINMISKMSEPEALKGQNGPDEYLSPFSIVINR